MRVSTLFCFLACLFFFGQTTSAQDRNCGSMDYLQQQMEQDPKRAKKLENIENFTRQYLSNPDNSRIDGIVTIPVVVHVVWNTSAENISDAQILSQIQVLNEDFRRLNSDADGTWPQAADAEIEFCLASVDPSGNATTGITRTNTSVTSFSGNDNVKFDATGGKDAWPSSDYLNFWVCDLAGGLLGYAQFPGGNPATDGVVNDYAYTGSGGSAQAPFDLGRTATHEVGHWLNLRHIWGDGGCSVDDFVSDTPTSDASNGGCNVGHVSCGTVDMVQNYMDYSDDACMNLYTQGQKDRMRALFDPGGFRESILSSGGCGSGNPPTCTDGIQNGNETGVDCGGPDCPACPPAPTCTDGVQNGSETGVDCGGPDCPACPCAGTNITITITLDNYPEETSWTLVDDSGTTVGSGGTYGSQPDGSTVTISGCVADGCYDFTIFDSYGDGICCAYGNGSYSVTDDMGNTYASGGAFGSSETTNFCLGGGPAPTCTDGIQNGNETGVDCGGPDCPPCNTGCSYTNINFNSFEAGWGIWNDGGSDCRRSANDAAYANGTYCVRLRDNTSTSTMTTDNLDLTGYDELTVSFSYLARSMENLEDFWLQISTNGGGSYTTVEEWNRGDEFENNIREAGSAVIAGPFSTNTRLRFRCDASGNSDWVYIDDVFIDGCANGTRVALTIGEETNETARGPVVSTPKAAEKVALAGFTLFPNPTSDILNVSFDLQKAGEVEVMITDFTGKVIQSQRMDGYIGTQQTTVDASQWSSGFYFVHLIADGKVNTKKFVVAK